MKRQEIKMKLLMAVERTKSKYEILSGKLTEILADFAQSQKSFMDTQYTPFANTKQEFSRLGPTLAGDVKFADGISDPRPAADSPLKSKESVVNNALKQLRTNYETLKKNQELMDTFTGDLAKDYDFTKGNLDKLGEDLAKLNEKQGGLQKKVDAAKEEVTTALIDNEFPQQKIIALNGESKALEDHRAEVEKMMNYLAGRLLAWKKHSKLLPPKHEKVANHTREAAKAMEILRKEAEKIAKLVEVMSRSPSSSPPKKTSPEKSPEAAPAPEPKSQPEKSPEVALPSPAPETKSQPEKHTCEHGKENPVGEEKAQVVLKDPPTPEKTKSAEDEKVPNKPQEPAEQKSSPQKTPDKPEEKKKEEEKKAVPQKPVSEPEPAKEVEKEKMTAEQKKEEEEAEDLREELEENIDLGEDEDQ